MKLIPLTQGQFAQVDDSDFEYLNQFKWSCYKKHKTYYAFRNKGIECGVRKKQLMHREILEINDNRMIDHIDRNGLNCQRLNLRICTYSENNANRATKNTINRTSTYKGVSRVVLKSNLGEKIRYRAVIAKDKKDFSLGTYDTEIEAAKAYNKGASLHHGEFAYLNNIN